MPDVPTPQQQTAPILSVVLPCLNEARTLSKCIDAAQTGCEVAIQRVVNKQDNLQQNYEIIVADNGSLDGSQEIAIVCGAKLVPVSAKGYGAALRAGIAAAHGRYVVMGDSDCSYDFKEIPRFLTELLSGFDLVVGNRFSGGIKPGAMPWHHRYIGNPVLSCLGGILYRSPCRDWHCGLRAFDRNKIHSLGLRTRGMEFASEMILRAVQEKLRIQEIPIFLYPDGRDRRPHLRSFRDGMRHLSIMFRSVRKPAFTHSAT